MKKVFILLASVLCTLAASAASYTGKLTVDINGYVTTQDNVAITVEAKADGTYYLCLKNFVLMQGNDPIEVGNIELDTVPVIKACGFTAMGVSRNIYITEGDLEGTLYWLGPDLEEVPISLAALFNDSEMRVHIDIDMTDSLGQLIKVDFETPGVDKPASGGVRGDVNGDNAVDIDDVNTIINIILKKE